MKSWFGAIIIAAVLYSGVMFLGAMHSIGLSFGLLKPETSIEEPPKEKAVKDNEEKQALTQKTQEDRMREVREQYKDYMERQKQRMKDYRYMRRK
ncbi:MAG: hypothetical protein K8S27_01915 [Candidatus Omnitrophica bacterium]|nr:hypothetical protein [Candidatus Omnitrophota bacterium]